LDIFTIAVFIRTKTLSR